MNGQTEKGLTIRTSLGIGRAGKVKQLTAFLRLAGNFVPLRWLMAAFFVCVILLSPFPALSETPIPIFYYSSESNINNYRSLKMEFDRYLSQFGPYVLQPFSDKETFEDHIRKSKEYVLLISSWHYMDICRTMDLKSVCIGTKNGSIKQKRLLVAEKDVRSLSIALNRPATAISRRHTLNELKSMVSDKTLLSHCSILKVPKDIDALMAVGFEISTSAVIAEHAYDQLKQFNPALFREMKVLARGPSTYLTVLAVPRQYAQQTHSLVSILEQMPDSQWGRRVVQMIGLDGWRTVTKQDRLTLETVNSNP